MWQAIANYVAGVTIIANAVYMDLMWWIWVS